MKKGEWQGRALAAERLLERIAALIVPTLPGNEYEEWGRLIRESPIIDLRKSVSPLTPRELEILDSIAHGMTNKQVATHLSISEQTVKNHMSKILFKLSVNDRTQAVVCAIRAGWVEMAP